MNTLDRYIARQYLFNVIALLVVLFSFVVAVDVSLNIDKYIEAVAKMDPDAGAIRRTALIALGVIDIWWPKLLQLFNYMVGLVLVAAMGFTFTQLVRHREMVAVLAGGISLHRAARPVLLVAIGVMALRWINSEVVLSNPAIAPLLTRDPSDIGKRSWAQFRVTLIPDASGRVFLAETFDPVAGVMENLTVWERDRGGAAGAEVISPPGGQRAIHAARAVWETDGWVLSGAWVQPLALSEGGTATGEVPPPPPAKIQTDLSPEVLKLKRFEAFSQTLSWGQISELVRNSRAEVREKLQRIRWGRVSQTLSSLLALVITMPFFLTREPKNMMVQSLKCAPVGILSLMGGILLSSVAYPGLPPGFGVFVPVVILCPIAIASVSWMRT
ncbi:MAG TPA: LptF/LptG family permease [Phycisphaerales bacterium]|nr:LptF/LptG family permease [Phycisphaerales bacterium]